MSFRTSQSRQSIDELLAAFRARSPRQKGEKLVFRGVEGKDVYNITAPFPDRGELVIAGRVEARENEQSEIRFFVERDGVWHLRPGSPVFPLQDPFVSRIGGELVFGGVEVYPDTGRPGRVRWRTQFYRGSCIDDLRHFATGPEGMKDIRLVQLADGSVGVFTRPQGNPGGRGTIGFLRIGALEALDEAAIGRAKLLTEQFIPEEWGGANELHLLSNGLVGVLGHIARYGPGGVKQYYSMVFAFDPEREVASPMEIIAVRENFPPGEAKTQRLVDVLFSGGLVRNGDGTAVLYVGVSDAEAHRIVIEDPFLKWEQDEAIKAASPG